MELILTPEEHELLLDVLEQHHRELQKEIAHTDHRDFRATLRKNESLIESMLSRLQVSAGSQVA